MSNNHPQELTDCYGRVWRLWSKNFSDGVPRYTTASKASAVTADEIRKLRKPADFRH
ncbi:hypothetical protein [Streptomyces sp. NPDC001389]|uniref:hypothetical protein n=1 Tax=Streptomyces sp. NPDC001389 TaxID=3364569 RepID=UPI000A680830